MVEEEAEEELAEVVEAVALEVREEEEVEVGASEEGEEAVVASEGEDIKYQLTETSADFCVNLRDLLLWIRNLCLEQA